MKNQGKRKSQIDDSGIFAFGALLLIIGMIILIAIVKNI
jgi:hypothetical protein